MIGSRSKLTVMAEQSAAVAPETVPGLTEAQVVDLVESWLRAEPGLRYGKARAQGLTLRLDVTRRQFTEARARIGLTARVAPRAAHPRGKKTGAEVSNGAGHAVAEAPAVPTTRPRVRRRRGPLNLAGLSNLAETLEAIVAERERARAAIEEIRRIVKGLR